jgi:hypothetical protein
MNDERMSNLIIKEFSGVQYLNVQLTCILGNIFGEVGSMWVGSTQKMQFEPDVHVVHFYISSEHHPTLFTEESQTKENNVHTYRNLSTNGTHNENQKLC